MEDAYRQVAPFFRRPGPAACCSDSELMTMVLMVLVGECKGWDSELTLLSEWSARPDLFPNLPSQSRFNRRRRNLWQAFNLIRKEVLRVLELAQDRECCIDSLPVPVVQAKRLGHAQANKEWASHGASFGRVPSKNQSIFGYKMQLLVTVGGVIIDFELVPAHIHDIEAGQELLEEHTKRSTPI